MDIKKYLLDQIKTYESLMRDLEEEPKQKESDKPKKQYKQKPNSILLDKINADIKNQKRLTNYYKSIKTGTPFVEEDDNIRLVNNNNNLDSSLENQFNFLMSKYVKDQTTLTNIQNNLTPEMLSELIHNWALYEPEIRRFKGQYVDSNLFLDKIRNMLLKNVNLKYPQTRNLNSVIDASREPDIEMQKAFEAKNRAVDEQITEEEQNQTSALQQLSFIKNWIGTSNEFCNKEFELKSEVIDKFNLIFNQKFDNINQMNNILNSSKSHIDYKDEINIFYNWCKTVYDGSLYKAQLKDEPGSFRTIYINRIIIEYNKIKSPEIDKTFQDYLLKYGITYGNPNGSGQLPKLESFLVKQTNLNLININDIIEALKTDKHLSQYKKYDRNKLIKKLKEEPNNKGDIIYDDLTTEQLLELYKKITGKEYIGSGILRPTEKQINKKYFIDTNKLNNNVLEVRYNKNRHLTNIKSQIIGNGVKNIIHNIINDDTMNEKEYHELTENEKHLIRTILNMLEKSHLIKNKDQEFNEKFQILLGSYNAGNNSEILKNQLRQYIIHAMKLGIIPRNTGNAMLLELSL